MERLGSLLVSSLSLEELGFRGREERPAWVFLGLGMVPSSESSRLPSEKLCFLKEQVGKIKRFAFRVWTRHSKHYGATDHTYMKIQITIKYTFI